MPRQLSPASTLDNLRKEAKRWLKALRAADAGARARLLRSLPDAPPAPTLRDMQHALAAEHGLPGWTALKQKVARLEGTSDQDRVIMPPEFESTRPCGPWSSRGCDIRDAIRAARAGDIDTLRGLLARDANLARYDDTIRFAARAGHTDIVRLLLDHGADPDVLSAQGENLITVASDRGHEGVARLIESVRRDRARTVPADTAAPDHAIHRAADRNDVDAVRHLLEDDPLLVGRSDRKGATPLHRAAAAAAHDVIRLLLDRGADIHALHGAGPGDAAGYAPVDHQPIDLALFHHRRGDLDTARLLVQRGAAYDLTIAAAFGDIQHLTTALDATPSRIREARPMGKRPLSAAVEFGHDPIVGLLLTRGADPNWPEANDDAPQGVALHSASRMGNRAIVELLLDHGADPNASVNASGSPAWTAKTRDLRALLLSRGARLDCYDLVWLGEDEEVMRRVTADPAEAEAGCGGVFTAAATLGKRDLVIRLLDAGIRVPPVLTACRSYLLENPEILRILLKGGMNPDQPNWQRATPLHDLCGRDMRGRAQAHRVECATILLDAGASISSKDEEYRSTPLAWAARNNLPDMVDLLLSRGAPANLPDDEPWATPLSWALRRGHDDIVQRLRAAGAT
jgi:ankyrin repeat protein